MSDQYGEQPPPRDPDRPGPYQGVFGGQSLPGSPAQPAVSRPNPYSQVHAGPPRQVIIASVISFALGVLTILLGLFALTSAGQPITETLTGDKDAQNVVLLAAVICSAAYILPAIFVRKQRPWARTMLIVVAVFGVAGSVTALPGGLLGLGLHLALLVLMLQTPTKLWFMEARR
jgi:O-antigen/teichoic acid export membrane protein